MTVQNKQDSNNVSLRYCEESTIGVLPAAASQIWYPTEPNTFADFGGQVKTVARKPITNTRQNRKGQVVDLDAAGGFNSDMTITNMLRLFQGFAFADAREPYDSLPYVGTQVVDFAVVNATHKYTSAANASGGKNILANTLVWITGSAIAANNGLKTVSSVSTTDLVVSDVAVQDEATNALIRIQAVGYSFASASVATVVSGAYPAIHRASGAVDFTTFGLIPGEWVWIGGDVTNSSFATAACNGFARVRSVTATDIFFDKTDGTWTADAGTGKVVQMFWGKVIKNESTAALIKRRTYSLERDLGQANTSTAAHQTEVVSGAVPNQFTLNVKQGEKLTADLAFVATNYTTRTQAQGPLSAAAVAAGSAANSPSVIVDNVFNCANHFKRLRLSPVDPTNSNPTATFAYMTDFTIVVNNGVTTNKAVGQLAAFDASAGNFDVSGKVTAYFSDVAAIAAVRANSDVTLDCAFVQSNAGVLFDLPLIGLGDGRLSVQQDQPIHIPVDMNAAADPTFDHTLLLEFFPYLPTVAVPT